MPFAYIIALRKGHSSDGNFLPIAGSPKRNRKPRPPRSPVVRGFSYAELGDVRKRLTFRLRKSRDGRTRLSTKALLPAILTLGIRRPQSRWRCYCSEIQSETRCATSTLLAVNERMFGAAQKLYRVVEIATALFVYFLEIHPYANGNGHMTSRTSRLPI